MPFPCISLFIRYKHYRRNKNEIQGFYYERFLPSLPHAILEDIERAARQGSEAPSPRTGHYQVIPLEMCYLGWPLSGSQSGRGSYESGHGAHE
jgi:hypothetical protein